MTPAQILEAQPHLDVLKNIEQIRRLIRTDQVILSVMTFSYTNHAQLNPSKAAVEALMAAMEKDSIKKLKELGVKLS